MSLWNPHVHGNHRAGNRAGAARRHMHIPAGLWARDCHAFAQQRLPVLAVHRLLQLCGHQQAHPEQWPGDRQHPRDCHRKRLHGPALWTRIGRRLRVGHRGHHADHAHRRHAALLSLSAVDPAERAFLAPRAQLVRHGHIHALLRLRQGARHILNGPGHGSRRRRHRGCAAGRQLQQPGLAALSLWKHGDPGLDFLLQERRQAHMHQSARHGCCARGCQLQCGRFHLCGRLCILLRRLVLPERGCHLGQHDCVHLWRQFPQHHRRHRVQDWRVCRFAHIREQESDHMPHPVDPGWIRRAGHRRVVATTTSCTADGGHPAPGVCVDWRHRRGNIRACNLSVFRSVHRRHNHANRRLHGGQQRGQHHGQGLLKQARHGHLLPLWHGRRRCAHGHLCELHNDLVPDRTPCRRRGQHLCVAQRAAVRSRPRVHIHRVHPGILCPRAHGSLPRVPDFVLFGHRRRNPVHPLQLRLVCGSRGPERLHSVSREHIDRRRRAHQSLRVSLRLGLLHNAWRRRPSLHQMPGRRQVPR
eukprot:comp17491_c0_seq1/m.29652 comp17491_c0_seq1/g.29652  ORF comp17491_c0_seq1/g.29652 comp17491_c0_seq1/m.29652 type:complete len:528 (+) comp17491_c0_seq1:376-1959(+)